MRRISNADYRLLRRILANRNNNNSNNNGSPRRERERERPRRTRGRTTEKTKYLNSGMRRVYLNTNRNRHFVYTGPERHKVRTYTEIFAFKNDWNQIRRISGMGARRRPAAREREEIAYRRQRR